MSELNSSVPLLLWALVHRHWWRCALHPALARFHPRTWLGVWGVLLAQLGAYTLALQLGPSGLLAGLFVATLRQRCQLRLLRNAPAEFDGWHWRPGSDLLVEFAPR